MASAFSRCAALCAVALTTAHCAAPAALAPNYVARPQVLSQGGLTQIEDGTGYLSYQTPLPKDFPGYRYVRRARGEVCQNDLQLPLQLQGVHGNAALSGAMTLDIIWGNAAVAQGVADALSGAPAGAVLYDLTLDLQKISVLGLFFRRQCLVVSGSLALPAAANAVSAPSPLEAPVVEKGAAQPAKPDLARLPLAPIPPHQNGAQSPKESRGARQHLHGRHKIHKTRSGGHKKSRSLGHKSSAGHSTHQRQQSHSTDLP